MQESFTTTLPALIVVFSPTVTPVQIMVDPNIITYNDGDASLGPLTLAQAVGLGVAVCLRSVSGFSSVNLLPLSSTLLT